MIIGIRGQSGAGKSLLASMVAYCMNCRGTPNIMGYMEAKTQMERGYFSGKWRTDRFSSVLKIIMATVYGIDYRDYESGKFKDSKINQRLFTISLKMTKVNGETKLVPLESTSDQSKVDALLDHYRRLFTDDVPVVVTHKDLTWRDTLNLGSEGLHLFLGNRIILEAYKHRIKNTVEHLILEDVRKPEEIDLIKSNGGVVIELQRDFIFPATGSRATYFFKENGYFYLLVERNNPVKSTCEQELRNCIFYNIPIGIDCRPKENYTDRWLDGDNRRDILIRNPANDPLNPNSFTDLFEEVVKQLIPITDLLTRAPE